MLPRVSKGKNFGRGALWAETAFAPHAKDGNRTASGFPEGGCLSANAVCETPQGFPNGYFTFPPQSGAAVPVWAQKTPNRRLKTRPIRRLLNFWGGELNLNTYRLNLTHWNYYDH